MICFKTKLNLNDVTKNFICSSHFISELLRLMFYTGFCMFLTDNLEKLGKLKHKISVFDEIIVL